MGEGYRNPQPSVMGTEGAAELLGTGVKTSLLQDTCGDRGSHQQ